MKSPTKIMQMQLKLNDSKKGCGKGCILSYLQNSILIYSYGISSLRDAVKNHKKAGVTDAQVDQLFALYW